MYEDHVQHVEALFERASKVLRLKGFSMRLMKRRKKNIDKPAARQSACTLAYIDLEKKLITIDVLTPVRRKPKSTNSLLRILAHEFAHYQKPPYIQRYKGRRIVRQHFPTFYKQVVKNVNKFKKDKELGVYFPK